MVFGGSFLILVRQTESSVQKIMVQLRPWMPLLALLCVTMGAWEVSATTPEVVPTAETPPPPRIIVNIAARRLYLYDERAALVKTYPVAVGSPRYRTPIRAQALRTIVWNAWWMPPPSPWAQHAKPTPPGKHNPLGNIKMPLGASLMLHGTNKPRSIGTAASYGCIRLFTQDAWELARWLQSHSLTPHSDDLFQEYARNRHRSFSGQLGATIPVDLVYDYVEIRADQLHVYHDIYARIGNKWAHILQTLAAHGYAADSIDQAALQQRLKDAKFRDVVIALTDIRRQPPLQPPLASHSVDKEVPVSPANL
jgi:lipoprotein-anchoring transpeptidase ErfK/SrfK